MNLRRNKTEIFSLKTNQPRIHGAVSIHVISKFNCISEFQKPHLNFFISGSAITERLSRVR